MHLRRKIQILVLATLFLAFAVAGTIIVLAARNHLLDGIDDRITETAEALVNVGQELGPTGLADAVSDVGEAARRTEAMIILEGDESLALALPSGTRAAGDPLPDLDAWTVAGLQAEAGTPFTVDSADGSITYRAVGEPLGPGVVVVATPLTDVEDTLRSLVLLMVVVTTGVLIVVGLVTVVLSRRAVRPMNDMIAAADAIGAGNLAGRIPTTDDVPETRQLGEALNNMLHQLEESLAARESSDERLRQFVADASHELRTPLTSIRGYAELYLTGVATDDEAVGKAMQRIRSEAVRTGDLVNDLILLARVDQGRALASAPVDLSRIVDDSVTDLRAVQPDRPIEVDIRSGVVVDGDEPSLRQVVANVLDNARVHAGDSPMQVRLSTGDEAILLSVADEGPGMDPEQVESVFDRFWRAEDSRSRRRGGSGLGLSIVDSVVRSHGGTVTVRSEVGRGTTFEVRMPARENPSEQVGMTADDTGGGAAPC